MRAQDLLHFVGEALRPLLFYPARLLVTGTRLRFAVGCRSYVGCYEFLSGNNFLKCPRFMERTGLPRRFRIIVALTRWSSKLPT